MNGFLILPILWPLAIACAGLAVRRHERGQRLISLTGSAGLLLINLLIATWVLKDSDGILVLQVGGWPAPFGITLVADALAAIMLVAAGLMGLLVDLHAQIDPELDHRRYSFHPFYQILLAGICGAFLAGDLFNLYVWFEVILIASFALLTVGGGAAQLDGAIKYVALNLVSTMLLLTAIALLFGKTGTLNFADLHLAVNDTPHLGLMAAIEMLMIMALGIKAAIFPMFFWLPASYHTPPVTVTAIFAALLTKVGVYALIRTTTLLFTQDMIFNEVLLMMLGAFTMLTGVLGALGQNNLRRLLSFHIISQIGYMIVGIAIHSAFSLAAALFFVVHNIFAKTALILGSGLSARLAGSEDLDRIGGLYNRTPWVALLFLIPAFSLAGFPPLAGFWAKFMIIKATLEDQQYVFIGLALIVSLLTLFSMTKIWAAAYWSPHPDGPDAVSNLGALPRRERWLRVTPIAILALLSVLMGLFPSGPIRLARLAGDQLMAPEAYVAAVNPQQLRSVSPVRSAHQLTIDMAIDTAIVPLDGVFSR